MHRGNPGYGPFQYLDDKQLEHSPIVTVRNTFANFRYENVWRGLHNLAD
ncbi:MAG: hypothetical protein RIS44_411 [Pseudomonadota bacterium]